MLSSAHAFVTGTIETIPLTGAAAQAGVDQGSDLFGQFVSVYQSNAFLFSELKSVKQKLASARSYLESPGRNLLLAQAQIDRLKARHSAVLTLLRANRLQARALIAGSEPAVEADVA